MKKVLKPRGLFLVCDKVKSGTNQRVSSDKVNCFFEEDIYLLK